MLLQALIIEAPLHTLLPFAFRIEHANKPVNVQRNTVDLLTSNISATSRSSYLSEGLIFGSLLTIFLLKI